MNKEWIEKGYIDEPVEASVDLKKEIRRLCREKDAVLLAHYYTVGDVQQVAAAEKGRVLFLNVQPA